MVWVGRNHKDHLCPTPLPWAGTFSSRPGCSKPHPGSPWTLPGISQITPMVAKSQSLFLHISCCHFGPCGQEMWEPSACFGGCWSDNALERWENKAWSPQIEESLGPPIPRSILEPLDYHTKSAGVFSSGCFGEFLVFLIFLFSFFTTLRRGVDTLKLLLLFFFPLAWIKVSSSPHGTISYPGAQANSWLSM